MCVRLACVTLLLTICLRRAADAAGHSDAKTAHERQARRSSIRKRDLRVSVFLSPRQSGRPQRRTDQRDNCEAFANCTAGTPPPALRHPAHLDADDDGEVDETFRVDGTGEEPRTSSRVWKHRGAFGEGMSTQRRSITFPKKHTHGPMLEEIRPTRQWKDLMQRWTPDNKPPSSYRRRGIAKRIVNERTIHLNTAPNRKPNRKTTARPSFGPSSRPTCNCSYDMSSPPWQSLLTLLSGNKTGGLMKAIVRASMSKTIEIERDYDRNTTSCKCNCTQSFNEPPSAPCTPSTGPYDRTLPDVIMPRARPWPFEPSEPPVVLFPSSAPASTSLCPRRVYVLRPGSPLPMTAQECKKLWLSHYSTSEETYWDCEDTGASGCQKKPNGELPFLGVAVSRKPPETTTPSRSTKDVTSRTQSSHLTTKKPCTTSMKRKNGGVTSTSTSTTEARHPLNLYFPFHKHKVQNTTTKVTTWSKVRHDHYPTTTKSRTSKGSRATTGVEGCRADNEGTGTSTRTTRTTTKGPKSTSCVNKLDAKQTEQRRKLNASLGGDLLTMCQSTVTPSRCKGSVKDRKLCNNDNLTLSSRQEPLATVSMSRISKLSTIYSTKSSTRKSNPPTLADVPISTSNSSSATPTPVETTSSAVASSTNERLNATLSQQGSSRHSHEFHDDDGEIVALTTAQTTDRHQDKVLHPSTSEAFAVPYHPASQRNTTSFAYPYHAGRRGSQELLGGANRETPRAGTMSSTEGPASTREVSAHEAGLANRTTETYRTTRKHIPHPTAIEIIYGINLSTKSKSSISQQRFRIHEGPQTLRRRHTEGALQEQHSPENRAAPSQADSGMPLQVSVLKSRINVNAMLDATKNVGVGRHDKREDPSDSVKSSADDDEFEYYYVYDDGTKVHI